jgi:hypothetical protein
MQKNEISNTNAMEDGGILIIKDVSNLELIENIFFNNFNMQNMILLESIQKIIITDSIFHGNKIFYKAAFLL